MSTHQPHLETEFSYRTRVVDYLWCGLPVVTTEGDALADLVARQAACGASSPRTTPARPRPRSPACSTTPAPGRGEADRAAAAAADLAWDASPRRWWSSAGPRAARPT